MVTRTIREVKKNGFFRLSKRDTAPVWVRGEYIPEVKKYSTYKFDDVSHERLCHGDKKVFVGFTF